MTRSTSRDGSRVTVFDGRVIVRDASVSVPLVQAVLAGDRSVPATLAGSTERSRWKPATFYSSGKPGLFWSTCDHDAQWQVAGRSHHRFREVASCSGGRNVGDRLTEHEWSDVTLVPGDTIVPEAGVKVHEFVPRQPLSVGFRAHNVGQMVREQWDAECLAHRAPDGFYVRAEHSAPHPQCTCGFRVVADLDGVRGYLARMVPGDYRDRMRSRALIAVRPAGVVLPGVCEPAALQVSGRSDPWGSWRCGRVVPHTYRCLVDPCRVPAEWIRRLRVAGWTVGDVNKLGEEWLSGHVFARG